MYILIIEDNSDLVANLYDFLEPRGYIVDAAYDARSGLRFARDNEYDAIILDLMLPKESSLLALHDIHELDPNVDILILSTPGQIHDRVTALIQGADDYLVEPFSIDDLHASIQSLLRRKADSEPGRD